MQNTLKRVKKLCKRPKSACENQKPRSEILVDKKRENFNRGKRILKEMLRLERNLEAER